MKSIEEYVSPVTETIEWKTEGVLCASGDLEAPGFYEGEEIM